MNHSGLRLVRPYNLLSCGDGTGRGGSHLNPYKGPTSPPPAATGIWWPRLETCSNLFTRSLEENPSRGRRKYGGRAGGMHPTGTLCCCFLFTARKRSLGQGNIFTSVCQEFCSQGGGAWSRGICPGGVCSGGCLVLGGLCSGGGCLVLGGLLPGECLLETPQRRLLLRAVRILLECILVGCCFAVDIIIDIAAFSKTRLSAVVFSVIIFVAFIEIYI